MDIRFSVIKKVTRRSDNSRKVYGFTRDHKLLTCVFVLAGWDVAGRRVWAVEEITLGGKQISVKGKEAAMAVAKRATDKMYRARMKALFA